MIIGVMRGLWVLSMLLGRIWLGGLIMTGLMIWGLVLPGVHGGAAKKEWGIIICGLEKVLYSVSEGVTWFEGLIRTTKPYTMG
jgi:hypothetical protein